MFLDIDLFMDIGSAADRPNILLFLVDDIGVGDTSVPFLYRDGKPVKIDQNDLYRTPIADSRRFRAFVHQRLRLFGLLAYPNQLDDRFGSSSSSCDHLDASKDSQVDTGFVKTGNLRSPSNWRLTGLDRSLPLLPTTERSRVSCDFCGQKNFGPDDTLSGNPTNLVLM